MNKADVKSVIYIVLCSLKHLLAKYIFSQQVCVTLRNNFENKLRLHLFLYVINDTKLT